MSEDDMKIEQSKQDRKEWETTPEGMLWAAAMKEVTAEQGGVGHLEFEEVQKLVEQKKKEMVSRMTNGNYAAE